MNAIQYNTNVEAHKTSTLYFKAGNEPVISYKGQSYSYNEFDKTFPINKVTIKPDGWLKGSNPDTTKEWIK